MWEQRRDGREKGPVEAIGWAGVCAGMMANARDGLSAPGKEPVRLGRMAGQSTLERPGGRSVRLGGSAGDQVMSGFGGWWLRIGIDRMPRTFLVAAMMVVIGSTAARSEDYYPDHPVVREMVDKAVDYLEKSGNGNVGQYEGGTMLMALAHYKVRSDSNHALVKRGIALAKDVANRTGRPDAGGGYEKIIYEAAVAAMLLASVDVDMYRKECETLRDFFTRVQRPYGAFGYLAGAHARTGDTSQVQYVILALWTLDQMGVPVQVDMVERCLKWLQAEQLASGSWNYQGRIGSDQPNSNEGAGGGFIDHRMGAAGLSAVLVAGDFLGFYRNRKADAEEDYIPKAFKRVVEEDLKNPRKKVTMQRDQVEGTINNAVGMFAKNPYTRAAAAGWHYYFRYSEERCEAFLEIRQGKQIKSPAWYNRGVEEFRKVQDPATGAFGALAEDRDNTPPEVSTSFAVLYLIRSTQKAIGKINEGMLMGGYELPKDLANAGSVDGKVVDKTKTSSLDDMLKMMEAEGTAKMDDALVSDRMKLDPDPKRRKEQLNRLSRLLSGKDPLARRGAAKLLGRGDDLDFVPALIYALTDPDPYVPKYAENSLRILSRRMTTRVFSIDQPPNEADRKKAVALWQEWYQGVRPDYVFVEQ